MRTSTPATSPRPPGRASTSRCEECGPRASRTSGETRPRPPRPGGYRGTAEETDLILRAVSATNADRRDMPVPGTQRQPVRLVGTPWGSRGYHRSLASVPHGGGYEARSASSSASVAVDRLRARARPGHTAAGVASSGGGRPLRVPCLGSRLLTGRSSRLAAAFARRDCSRSVMPWALPAGPRPAAGRSSGVGCTSRKGGRCGVRRGGQRDLAARPVALDFTGGDQPAPPDDRQHAPMMTFAYTVLAANAEARRAASPRDRPGRGAANATNVIRRFARCWTPAPRTRHDGRWSRRWPTGRDQVVQDGTQVEVDPDLRAGGHLDTPWPGGSGLLGGAPILRPARARRRCASPTCRPRAGRAPPTGVRTPRRAAARRCVAGVPALATVLGVT